MTSQTPDQPSLPLPQPQEAPDSFGGQRIAIVGLGIEGRDAEAFLQREGATIIRVDQDSERADRPQDDLTTLDDVDALVASQGVHYAAPLLVEAGHRGIPVYGPAQLFLERCPARVVGITGSAGKTTTATLTHLLLEAAGIRAHLGGNIGRGLLAQLPDITPDDIVVAEISHTQLVRTTRSPQTAAITNITPNHLDQFSWDDYQQLKFHLVEYQSADDVVILPLDDERAAQAANHTPARQRWFGIADAPPDSDDALAARSDGHHILRHERPLMPADELRIPGRHNLLNALAALAIVGELVPDDTAADVLRSFSGVPHRLELVDTIGGVRFINDSIATTPERTLAGLRATDGPVVLMLGGRDKQLPLDPLLDELRGRVRAAILFGEAAPEWTRWLSRHNVDARNADTLEGAFSQAVCSAQPGDVVLLSPAGTSFDAYPNFEARGQHFRDLVEERSRSRSTETGASNG